MSKPYFIKNLRSGEQLLGVFHPSFWAVRGSIFTNILLWCVPFFLLIPLLQLKMWGYIIGGIVLFFNFWWSLRIWVTWYFTSLVVTDRRTIYYRQKGFFNRNVAEVPFRALQDISYERKGVNAVLTNFGSIIIQSASSLQHLECQKISHPDKVVELIRQAQAVWNQTKHNDPAYDVMYANVPSAPVA